MEHHQWPGIQAWKVTQTKTVTFTVCSPVKLYMYPWRVAHSQSRSHIDYVSYSQFVYVSWEDGLLHLTFSLWLCVLQSISLCVQGGQPTHSYVLTLTMSNPVNFYTWPERIVHSHRSFYFKYVPSSQVVYVFREGSSLTLKFSLWLCVQCGWVGKSLFICVQGGAWPSQFVFLSCALYGPFTSFICHRVHLGGA